MIAKKSQSLKQLAKRFMAAVGRLPGIFWLIRLTNVRAVIQGIPGLRALYDNGWDRRHPFDQAYGTETSGFVPTSDLNPVEPASAHANFYAGCQPSILRKLLGQLPALDDFMFVDLGCGKGRALLAASEFGFREILGVELSPALAEIARDNAAHVAKHHPKRTPVHVVTGDASTHALPAGNLVLFLYHPFGAELVGRVVQTLDKLLEDHQRTIFVIYYNPVAYACFDNSRRLHRSFAEMVQYSRTELGYGPDTADPVMIWQGGSAGRPAAMPSPSIDVLPGGMRVQFTWA